MNKILLKMFSINLLIELVIVWLTSTVKNPLSAKTLQLRSIVFQLYKAARRFLEGTGGIPQED